MGAFSEIPKDIQNIAKNPMEILAAPLTIPFNFGKRALASAFDLGTSGGEKALDVMKDLVVRMMINSIRYTTKLAVAGICYLPILPMESGGSLYGLQMKKDAFIHKLKFPTVEEIKKEMGDEGKKEAVV